MARRSRALHLARDDVEIELNCAADSPLVLADSGEMLSSGNFHIPGLALAFDALGLALAHAALLCVMRCQKLYSPALSGLPLQLTTRGPEHSGFATTAENADRAVEPDSSAGEPGVARHPAGVGGGRGPRADGGEHRRQDGRDGPRSSPACRHRAHLGRAGHRPSRHSHRHAGPGRGERLCGHSRARAGSRRRPPARPGVSTVAAALAGGALETADLLAR